MFELFDDSVRDDLNEEYESILALLGNKKELLRDVMSLLRKEGLSEKLYAQIFRIMFFTSAEPDDRLSYSEAEKVWMRGPRPISDMELVSVFSETVYLVRKCVGFAWNLSCASALFPAWENQKEFAKTEITMDSVESFGKLRNCLRMAGEIMPAGGDVSADINWSSEEKWEDEPGDTEG